MKSKQHKLFGNHQPKVLYVVLFWPEPTMTKVKKILELKTRGPTSLARWRRYPLLESNLMMPPVCNSRKIIPEIFSSKLKIFKGVTLFFTIFTNKTEKIENIAVTWTESVTISWWQRKKSQKSYLTKKEEQQEQVKQKYHLTTPLRGWYNWFGGQLQYQGNIPIL